VRTPLPYLTHRARGMSPTQWRALHRHSPCLVSSKPVRLPHCRVKVWPTEFDFLWLSKEGYL
jgi:hypothetical protein